MRVVPIQYNFFHSDFHNRSVDGCMMYVICIHKDVWIHIKSRNGILIIPVSKILVIIWKCHQIDSSDMTKFISILTSIFTSGGGGGSAEEL